MRLLPIPIKQNSKLMQPYLKITRIPYEEPYHLQLEIEASNARQTGWLQVYVVADDLMRIARALEQFPQYMGSDST